MAEDFYEKEQYRRRTRQQERDDERAYKERLRKEDRQYKEEAELKKQDLKAEERVYKETQDERRRKEREESQEKRHEQNLEAFDYKTAIQQGINAEAAQILARKEIHLAELHQEFETLKQREVLKKELLFFQLDLQAHQSHLDMDLADYEEREESDLSRRLTESVEHVRHAAVQKIVEMAQQRILHRQNMELVRLEGEVERKRMMHETNEKVRLEKALMDLNSNSNEKTDEEIVAILSKHIK